MLVGLGEYMENLFFEYYPISQEKIDILWKQATIVLDTSFLLNIYRYSKKTRSELIKVLSNLEDRLWISNQICYEFLENRLKVISDQEKIFDDVIDYLGKIETKISNKERNPNIESEILKPLLDNAKVIIEHFEKQKSEYSKLSTEDNFLETVTKVYKDKVGKPFSDEKINTIINEGKRRYENKIPPGYEDTKKPDNRKYGDYISWEQIIEYSKSNIKDILFITDDVKEDWWEIYKGEKIGPRRELRKELKIRANSDIHMYTGSKFLELSNKYLEQKISRKTIGELSVFSESLKSISKGLQDSSLKFSEVISNSLYDIQEKFVEINNNLYNYLGNMDYNELLNKTPILEILEIRKRLEDSNNSELKNAIDKYINSNKEIFENIKSDKK